MKGKKPTRAQKNIMQKNGDNPLDWLVLKNPTNELVIQNKKTGFVKTIEL